MTSNPQGGPNHGTWWLALAAIPILCCVGPAALAALAASRGLTAASAATGNTRLTALGALLTAIALAVVLRRTRRRRHRTTSPTPNSNAATRIGGARSDRRTGATSG